MHTLGTMNTSEKTAAATLRIHTTVLSLEDISAALRIEPSEAFAKGERMSLRNPSSAVFEENLWSLDSWAEPRQPLEIHIQQLIDFLEQRLPEIKRLISDCDIDIFCMYSSENGQGGFTLAADVMKRLAAIPVDIVFDIYC